MQIAILFNDRKHAKLACDILSAIYHTCYVFQDIAECLEHLKSTSFDLLIIDAIGLSATHMIRNVSPSLPILLIAETSQEDYIRTATSIDINDYLLKPIRRAELITRVNVLFKHMHPEHMLQEEVLFGPYTFNISKNYVTRASEAIALTQKEFKLALLFFQHLGRPLSRAFIQEAIWSREAEIPSRTIDTHVSRVRSKLGLRPENGFHLVPVYSYGYKLEQLPE